MRLIQMKEGNLSCSCGSDIFVSYGDDFGFTKIQCKECDIKTSIIESSLIAEKLLNACGEDYCKVFGNVINDILMVDYLLFTEFETKVTISIEDRREKVISAKQEAVNKQWFERAARLRDEERIIDCVMQQQNKILML